MTVRCKDAINRGGKACAHVLPDQLKPKDAIMRDWHCSTKCCQESVDQKVAAFEEFRVRQHIPPGKGRGPRNRSPREKSRYSAEQNAAIANEFSELKRAIESDVKKHVRKCSPALKKGEALSNERRKEMGWPVVPPATLALPAPELYSEDNRLDYQGIVDELNQSEFQLRDRQVFEQIPADQQATNTPTPRFSSGNEIIGSSSGQDNANQKNARIRAAREREIQEWRDNEQARLTRESYAPNPDDFIVLGSQRITSLAPPGHDAGGDQSWRDRSQIRSGESPRQASLAPAGGEQLVLDNDGEQDLATVFEDMGARFLNNVHRLGERQQQLLRLRTHLQEVQPLGPDPQFHAAQFVVRRRNFSLLHGHMIQLERALGEARELKHVGGTDYNMLENLRSDNHQLLEARMMELDHWAWRQDTGTVELVEHYDLFEHEADEELMRDPHQPRKQQQARNSSDTVPRSSPTDSRDSIGNPKFTYPGRGREGVRIEPIAMAQIKMPDGAAGRAIGEQEHRTQQLTHRPRNLAPQAQRDREREESQLQQEADSRRRQREASSGTPQSSSGNGQGPQRKRSKRDDDKGEGEGKGKGRAS